VPIEAEALAPHSRRAWVPFALLAVAVAGTVGMVLAQRILRPLVRGDVKADSVLAVSIGSAGGTWSRSGAGHRGLRGARVAGH